MNDATLRMTRYFLGELTESERDELEAQYFDDSHVFDQLTAVEAALVDDYVRGRLGPDVRQRFEAHYLADPPRRERVRFAETLLATVERRPAVSPVQPEWHPGSPPNRGAVDEREQTRSRAQQVREFWLAWMHRPRLAMTLATAIVAGTVAAVLITDSRRPPQGTASTADERPVPNARGAAPATEAPPAPSPASTPTPPASPSSPARPSIAVVTLALTVGPAERVAAPGALPAFVAPPATGEIRFVLTLREHDYDHYRVIVQAIGGGELFRRDGLVPAAGSQPTIALVVSAAGFEPADYLLTLQGARDAGEFEDLSQTLFRVNRPGAQER